MNIVKTVQVPLKNGFFVTLDVSDVLLERVKAAFMLNSIEEVTDTQVKYYIVSSMKNAVGTEKAT